MTWFPQPPRLRKILYGLGGIALASLLISLLAYYEARAILCVDSGSAEAEAIVVLGGDPIGRPVRAAELFTNRIAPLIVVSGDGDDAEVVRVLKSNGVPAHAIQVENRSRSTKENAEFSVQLLRAHGVKRVIVVTSWFHSRRALNCFHQAAPDMQFVSRPSYYGWDRSTWSRNGVGDHVRMEYVKLLGYWVRYGISPF